MTRVGVAVDGCLEMENFMSPARCSFFSLFAVVVHYVASVLPEISSLSIGDSIKVENDIDTRIPLG